MVGRATRLLPYCLAFFSSMCIMTLELVSSRLVARHVGASLAVWTSVIGIILGGICLGNVLGGRLADRVRPRSAVGPLFALGSFLTLFTLWMNAWVGLLLPYSLGIPWEIRTVLVVSIVFLVPATVLGMVGPVVAKMAVEQAQKAGSAIGDVYFWGAVGSIVGTFFCGFVLLYVAPSSIIVLLVAAALAALAGALMRDSLGLAVAMATAVLLLVGSIFSMLGNPNLGAIDLGSYQINYVSLLGTLSGCVLGVLGGAGLLSARSAPEETGSSAGQSKAAKEAAAAAESGPSPSLADLAMLAFVASLVFMSFEMVAGRLVQRYLGSSIYGWTSVIGVLLAGLSMGNFLGGKIADFIKNEKQASWLFLAASVVTLIVIPLDTQPAFVAEMLFGGAGDSVLQQVNSLNKIEAGFVTIWLNWPFRILFAVALVFFLPAVTMGTVSPVVAKLAVDRLKKLRRTGTAIGQVYAWGMVGSILGTFLTGFLLINVLGTKGVILLLGALLAFCATLFGPTWHAIWAGIPLGLCALAFTPPWFVDLTIKRFAPFVSGQTFEKLGTTWGIREEEGDPNSTDGKYAWIDESNYYYIKVNNENLANGTQVRRTLVLDNLIHGYFMLGVRDLQLVKSEHDVNVIPKQGKDVIIVGSVDSVLHFRIFDSDGGMVVDTNETKLKEHAREIAELKKQLEEAWPPHELNAGEKGIFVSELGAIVGSTLFSLPERLDYDYEHIYALVAYRAAKATGKLTMGFKEATAAPPAAGGAPPEAPAAGARKDDSPAPAKPGEPAVKKKATEGKSSSEAVKKAPGEKGGATKSDAQPVVDEASEKKPSGLQSVQATGEPEKKEPKIPSNSSIFGSDLFRPDVISHAPDTGSTLPDVKNSSMKTLFLGGGAYCFQRHIQRAYPNTEVDVAEIDPNVTRANYMATGLPRDTTIKTYWGDARQFVELHQDTKEYDLIFGDAFNDFSVPWHLTTLEFNQKLKKMMSPNGVYMINIIDAYESDAKAKEKAEEQIQEERVTDDTKKKQIRARAMAKAYRFGGFVGAWVRTAKKTFDHVYIFGTDSVPGEGSRETFVVVVSNQALDLKDLGKRADDPKFYKRGQATTPKPYSKEDEEAIDKRSRNIILTDDYAPVDNLLAPVAETRGED